MDVITRLTDEHDALRSYLQHIEAAAEARDPAMLAAHLEAARDTLTDELDAHIAVEEAEVFAGASETVGKELVTPFYEEHVEIRALRDNIFARLARGEAPYEPCLRLCDLVMAHQQREDLMLFPSAREAVSQ